MADYLQTGVNTSISGSYNFFSNDWIYILPTGAVILSGPATVLGTAPGATGISYTIHGQIDVASFYLGADSTLMIGQTGSLTTHGKANNNNLIVGGTAGGTLVYNQGDITVQHNYGLALIGGSNQVINSGRIFGDDTAISLGAGYATGDKLNNSGWIQSNNFQAVEMKGGLEQLTNSGTITSLSGVAIYVLGENDGTTIRATSQSVTNSGLIQSDNAEAVYVLMSQAASIFTLHNSGTLRGETYAVYASAEIDQIFNTGTLDGLVGLGDGADILDTRGGTVTGDIYLGSGSDTFLGIGATIHGTVVGGSGNDTYSTDDALLRIQETATPGEIDTVYAAVTFRLADNIEALTLTGTANFNGFGNGGKNTLTGNVGDNRLVGLNGNDVLNGDLGNDRLLGGNQNDKLGGDDGDDTLIGNGGKDVLSGGDGDDVLIGGLGKDKLTGGADADTFVFATLAQSGASKIKADLILDFTQGTDHIDLSAIDAKSTNGNPDDAFTFIGTTGFSDVAGQLRYVQTGGKTLVAMDVDGDGRADSMILLSGTIDLTAADFVL